MGCWRDWTRREGKRFIYETGMLCNAASLALIFISFCSGFWIVSWPRVYSGFKRIGLWEVCFAGMVLETDPEQKAYHGCWWILAPEFMAIKGWLMPPWFIFTQVSVTMCFCAQAVGTAIMIYIWVNTGGMQMTIEDKNKKREAISLLQTAVTMTVVTAFVMAITLLVFGVMFIEDRNWLPYPHFNYLSWSYGLAVCSCFFQIFASICQVTYTMIVRQEMREPPRDLSSMGYRHPFLGEMKDTSMVMSTK